MTSGWPLVVSRMPWLRGVGRGPDRVIPGVYDWFG